MPVSVWVFCLNPCTLVLVSVWVLMCLFVSLNVCLCICGFHLCLHNVLLTVFGLDSLGVRKHLWVCGSSISIGMNPPTGHFESCIAPCCLLSWIHNLHGGLSHHTLPPKRTWVHTEIYIHMHFSDRIKTTVTQHNFAVFLSERTIRTSAK